MRLHSVLRSHRPTTMEGKTIVSIMHRACVKSNRSSLCILLIGYIFRNTASGPPQTGLYANYDLTKELGKGSFATVMQAMSKKNGQFYAVKMIQANKLRGHHTPNAAGIDGPSESAKWAREISIMQTLVHENICQLKEVFFESSNISALPSLLIHSAPF